MNKPQAPNQFTRIVSILIYALLLIGGSWATASAEQISMEYSFERPEITDVLIAGERYHRITMPGNPKSGLIGEPALPAGNARILLPYGTDVASVEIVKGEKISLGKDFYVEPIAPQGKLASEPPAEIPVATPDPVIYESDSPFPSSRFQKVGVQVFRGYRILNLKLSPVEYIPSTGELIYYPDLTVVVTLEGSDKGYGTLRGLETDEFEAITKVDNPENVASYRSAGKMGREDYDLLIITTSALASSFQPLKDYHDTTGIATQIHTTNDVGSSDPDDIRDYILQRYLNDGIQYVLIGADDDIIPAKDLFVRMSYPSGEAEYNMPSDVFFGCLDGTFNYDNDSYWGEPTDGDGGGDVDLFAEVWIGRAAVGTATEADRFVDKTIQYLETSNPYLQNVLTVGEHLGFGGPAEYAHEYLNELIDGSSMHGYTTIGIPSDIFDVDSLYEFNQSWGASTLAARINNGVHILNHLGHGSPDYAMHLYDSDVMSLLTNSDHCFVYSQTCLAGHLDGTDCWAEYMNIKTDAGAFAVIMNARYGFGEFNSTDGASQRFNREFWDAVFNPAEGKTELARANHDSKEDNYYRIGDDYMRWVYYELNLFGDPTVAFAGVISIGFEYPLGLPQIVAPGVPKTVEVMISGIGDGVPVPGTGQVHYSINGGLTQTEPMTEISPNYYTYTLPALTCGEILEYYFSAEEQTNGRIYNPNPNSPNVLVPVTDIATIFEDDFETDLGWTISGGNWARGYPTGSGGQYGGPDPVGGYSGSNVMGYNLNGDYENSMPERHVTSPAIDCSNVSNVKLKFWRWLGVEQPSYDHAYIRVSNNGSTWTTVWENTSEITDDEWTQIEVDISDIADNQSTVYIRFTMGTTDSGWRYCGWNIDDIEVSAYICDNTDTDEDGILDVNDNCPFIYNPDQLDSDRDGVGNLCDNCPNKFNPYQEDSDGDGVGDVCEFMCGDCDGNDAIDIDDAVFLIQYIFSGGPAPNPEETGDVDLSGECDIDDAVYIVTYIFSGGPEPCATTK